MEGEVKSHLHTTNPSILQSGLKERICGSILENEDVQIYWSIIASSWSKEEADELLAMITQQWITLRGFSFASSFNEEYKKKNKKTLEKSKGLRKNLIGKN